MYTLKRTDSDDPDFQSLVVLLDRELKLRDGDEHSFYAQFNKTDEIRNVILCYINGKAAGCGSFKEYNQYTAEIKRMFVLIEHRGIGTAVRILDELENWAAELNYRECILETGKKQPEAARLYQKTGYEIIPNYGQYEKAENSVCMKKRLKKIQKTISYVKSRKT